MRVAMYTFHPIVSDLALFDSVFFFRWKSLFLQRIPFSLPLVAHWEAALFIGPALLQSKMVLHSQLFLITLPVAMVVPYPSVFHLHSLLAPLCPLILKLHSSERASKPT